MSATILESDVSAAMSGDESAYLRLVDRSASTVCSIALAIVRNVEASEDVAQEVFLAAWTNLRKLRNPASYLPWLRQITRNQAHLWLREHRREVFAGDEVLASVVDERLTPADELLRNEEHRVLAEVLSEMPEETREVVILYYREHSSAQHVADLLGISEDAVRQRLSRARAKIREEMLERFGGTLVRTGPKAAFVTLIAGALTTAAPPAAAAVAGSAGAGAGKFAAPLLGLGTLLGASAGIAGILLGMKRLEPHFDSQEAEELRRFRNVAIVVMIVSSIVLAATAHEAPPRWSAVGPLVIFFALMGNLYFVRLPRILQRRYEWERAMDPQLAEQSRRSWMYATIGRAAGAVGSGFTFMLLLMRNCG
jgi:RNA polymerase sigma factor (sigma-70 family)